MGREPNTTIGQYTFFFTTEMICCGINLKRIMNLPHKFEIFFQKFFLILIRIMKQNNIKEINSQYY